MLRRLASLSITFALACTPAGDDVADAETQASSETAGDGDGDGDGDGTCYQISDEVTSVSVINCGFAQPCAEAEFVSSSCEVTADYDPAVGACIVEQLAAGAQALHVVSDCPGGQFSESWRLQVFGDGTVLYVDNQFLDIGGPGYATWRALPDAAYFQACQTDTPEALLDCLDGIREQECQLGEPSCP
jgi:hypothetical protein